MVYFYCRQRYCTSADLTPHALTGDYVDSVEDAKTTKTKIKPLIVLCLTDGRPDDPDGVKDCLIEMAGRLDEVRAP